MGREYRESRNPTSICTGHQGPISETPFKWRFAGVAMMALYGMPMIVLGILTNIAKEPYIFIIYQGGGVKEPLFYYLSGGGSGPLPPSLDPHMNIIGCTP